MMMKDSPLPTIAGLGLASLFASGGGEHFSAHL